MRTLTLIQEMYFDVVDIMNGESYKSLGYDSRGDFLEMLKEKLQEVEAYLEGMKMHSDLRKIDLLDNWCELEFGHTNWSMDADDEGNVIIKFPREDDDETSR